MSLLVHGGISGSGGSGSDALIFDRLEITKEANITDFYMNTQFNIDGLEITAVYKGNDTEYRRVVTNDCVYDPAIGTTLSSTGNRNVTISYTDLETTKTISYSIYIKLELDYFAAAPELELDTSSSYYHPYAGCMAGNNKYAIVKCVESSWRKIKGWAYNTALVKQALAITNFIGKGASVGSTKKYALIAAGYDALATSTTYTNVVDAYDDNLTKRTASGLLNRVTSMGSGSNDSIAIFAGGAISSTQFSGNVSAYNQNLIRTDLQAIYEPAYQVGVGASSSIIVAASGEKLQTGGVNGRGYTKYGCVYRADNYTCINRSATTTYPKTASGGASAGDYVLLIGGVNSDYACDRYADCWDAEGTKLSDIPLPASMRWMQAGTARNNGYALALENQNAFVFSKDLVQFPITGRSVSTEVVTATVGDYTFAGSGYGSPRMDVYKYTAA